MHTNTEKQMNYIVMRKLAVGASINDKSN